MNVRAEVHDVLMEVGFSADEVSDDRELAELGIDSTEMVEIVVAIERHFGFRAQPGADENLATVADLVAFAEKQVSEPARGA